jgi:hypothetical protein
MKTITITLTDEEFVELADMVGNDLDPDQTIEELVLELLADSLPWMREKHWPEYRLVDYLSFSDTLM